MTATSQRIPNWGHKLLWLFLALLVGIAAFLMLHFFAPGIHFAAPLLAKLALPSDALFAICAALLVGCTLLIEYACGCFDVAQPIQDKGIEMAAIPHTPQRYSGNSHQSAVSPDSCQTKDALVNVTSLVHKLKLKPELELQTDLQKKLNQLNAKAINLMQSSTHQKYPVSRDQSGFLKRGTPNPNKSQEDKDQLIVMQDKLLELNAWDLSEQDNLAKLEQAVDDLLAAKQDVISSLSSECSVEP